jgi:hypothetical protein
MIGESNEDLVVTRRRPRGSPMRAHRVGVALHGQTAAAAVAAGAVDFPGILIPDEESERSRWISSGIALLVHASVLGLILLIGWLAPEELKEQLIPVRILNEPEAPKSDPAPARRVLAERRSRVFQPQAQAVKPQVENPRVVARAAPQVASQKIEMNAVNQVAAPRQVSRRAVSVEKVSAVRSAAPQAVQGRVDVGTSGPALRGPIEVEAPVGASVGPRQVSRVGNTIGTGTVKLGDGSSVQEGIDSNRDVLGSATGPRLADVRATVGEGLMDGSGGTGEGGVSFGQCFTRPEVQEYWNVVHRRMRSRWVLPPDVPANQEIRLRFSLDAAGSAHGVELVAGGDPRLGKSAVDALRSAAPFPPMGDRVRCLSGAPIVGTFRNPLGGTGTDGGR